MFSNFFGNASMGASFSNSFNMNFGNQGQQQRQQASPGSESQQPPPAAESFLKYRLKETPVTADDLIEENNKECLICLDEHKIGNMACKLPCGHLYHKYCIKEWLKQHCTCPVCRYEVECSDPTYEVKRKERMKATRKLRMRLDEIKSAKISDLRKISDQLGVSIKRCIDKREIVDLLVASGKVDIVEGVPVIEIPHEEWMSKSVRELKELLLSFGLSSEEALYKDELRATLVNSGRVSILEASENENGNEDHEKESSTDTDHSIGTASNANDGGKKSPRAELLEFSREQLKALSIKELKFMLEALCISYAQCIDKNELVEALSKSKKIRMT